MSNQYSHRERQNSIQLLLDGKTPEKVSEITGINKNTIISWRTNHKNKLGVDFPKHYLATRRREKSTSKAGFKYSDEEIIALARLNPGFGMQRFVNALYPRKKQSTHGSQVRYRITMLLIDYKEETGEDLYDLLQDPSYSEMVTEREYRRRTGKTNLPRYSGRGSGPRVSIAQGGGNMRYVPLPPQEFNWGEIIEASKRPRHKGENSPLSTITVLIQTKIHLDEY